MTDEFRPLSKKLHPFIQLLACIVERPSATSETAWPIRASAGPTPTRRAVADAYLTGAGGSVLQGVGFHLDPFGSSL